nr:hypothetical protein [uncultured Hyphomonas sp.]
MSIIYGLGLERSIGPRLEVPLPYAMRERIQSDPDSSYESVLESHVAIELVNEDGEYMTVRRDIAGTAEQKLVRTWDCRLEEVDRGLGNQRDFFLYDAGAAVREDGFHHRLAKFIGWDLPQVPRFDGDEGLLYIETLFPMFFVEQKRGWSTVQGPLPTYLGIQDLPRRVLEFILDLDAGKVRRRRSELRKEQLILQARYRERRREVIEGESTLVRISGLPHEPTASFGQDSVVQLSIYYGEEWRSLVDVSEEIRNRISAFDESEFDFVDDAENGLKRELEETEEHYANLNSQIQILGQDYQLANSERQGFQDRVAALETDLLRNQDALKLQKLGSTLGSASTDHTCPTCQQAVTTELLPAVSREAMGLEENIVFIRSQLELYRAMLGSVSENMDLLSVRYRSMREDVQEQRSKIRSLKRDLLRPTKSPARSEMEEIVRLEARLERWQAQQEKIDGAVEGLREIARDWARVVAELKELGPGNLTVSDQTKINAFQSIIQTLLGRFRFSSFRADDITLSPDDFRPQVVTEDDDGNRVVKDIGFEASASDGIRLKWSYILALVQLSKKFQTNQMGFAVFDEPGQQQMRELDLAAFFNASAKGAGTERQILVTTSEILERVNAALDGVDATIYSYAGFILKKM